MRAVVLLCLLHAALGENYGWYGGGEDYKYDWDGPKDSEMAADHHADACRDQHSCGCCLMTQQIHKLKNYFNTSLNDLEDYYYKISTSLDHFTASRTAFSVALLNDDNMRCFGTKPTAVIIIYEHVFFNLGNGYNATTGIFTVPHSGVYIIALSIFSDAGSPNSRLAACASLQVNNKMIAGSMEMNRQDQEDSTSVVVALQLNSGDEVTVILPVGCFLCDDNSHYNTFSAFLLYHTDYVEKE